MVIRRIDKCTSSFESLVLKADLYQLFGALSGKNIAEPFVSVE